jgi:hypothetical protein
MLVQFKQTGITENLSNEVARGFIASGEAIEVKKRGAEPVKVYEPEFGVVMYGHGDEQVLAIQMQTGPKIEGKRAAQYYFGKPEHANAFRSWPDAPAGAGHYFSGFGRAIPDSVVAKYEKEYREHPEKTVTETNAIHKVTLRSGGDNTPYITGDAAKDGAQLAFNKEAGDGPRAGACGAGQWKNPDPVPLD